MSNLSILACVAVLVGGFAGAQDKSDLEAIWKDPTFKKQFVAGYGVNSDIEPRVTPEEVKVLDKVRPLMANDLPKAAETLRKAIKPDSSAILDFDLGGILFQQENWDGALQCYRTAVGKYPAFRRAWKSLGMLYARNENFEAAIEAFTRMIELGGADGYSYGLLGHAYASKQDYQASEAAFRNALLLQPENTQWRLGLTRSVFKQQKFEDAAALLDVLIERFPDKAEFWVLQAHTFIGMKQPLKAASNFEAVDLMGRATVDNLQTLGDIYVTESLTDLAERAYLRAIEADPKQPAARPLRAAEVLAARGATAQATRLAARVREVFEPAMEDGDRKKLLKLEVRLSMADGSGDEKAAAVLEEIVKLDPLDGDALLMLGQYHARHDEPDRATFFYERAESLEAFEVNAKVRHAQLLVGLGRYAEAIPLLRRAQEVKPREDLARYLEQIDRLAKSKR
jgi:tetratricopeptide (TPR) repeat protein